jgi:hypothetical protein
VDSLLLAAFETHDPALRFALERPDPDMTYYGLGCPCGGQVFRVSGWPRIHSGRGGFFWRSVTRVWREARLQTHAGQPLISPFWIPLGTRCDRCGRAETLFAGEHVGGRRDAQACTEPKESVRCRICRRSQMEIVVGVSGEDSRIESTTAGVSVEVVSRCDRCHRQARVAWSDGRRSEQEIRLDLLYGRV